MDHENFKQGKDGTRRSGEYPEKHELVEVRHEDDAHRRDLMHGCAELGSEESGRPSPPASRVVAPVDGPLPRTATSWRPSSTRTSDRYPSASVVATENDSLNGASMLFGYLLTNTPQIFSDVRTYWSPRSIREATG